MEGEKVIGYAEADGQYDWAIARVIQDAFGQFIITYENNDDAPSPEPLGEYYDARGQTKVGPCASLGQMFEELKTTNPLTHLDWPNLYKLAFLDALKTVNDELIANTRKGLGL